MMSINYVVYAISPVGKKTVLRFSTTQGYNQFLIDNKEWGFDIYGIEKHVRFAEGFEEVTIK